MKIEQKLNKLKKYIRDLKSVVIAYSGGVDSTFLAAICKEVLGKENILAVNLSASTHPRIETEAAKKNIIKLGIPYKIIRTNPFKEKEFTDNTKERCYFCKKYEFLELIEVAKKNGFAYIVEGTNADDKNDYRPGMKAIKELKIKSPLKEAGLSKDEIRKLSKSMGLLTWDKPSLSCLSTRFPYGEKITKDKVETVEKIEAWLRKFGFKQLRVRIHNP